ncbi:MAG: uridine kinase [Erysipelotrichaceae bacterium]|jgi:uridine kinase|nr:uridine kinase [Erysipelotrichaceae bacterium]
MKPIIIGIAGGSASGKSSIALKLYKQFEERKSVIIIRQDDYYKDQSHLSMEERVKTNYDHPFAFDTELLVKHLNSLSQGITIIKPIYDFTQHTRSKDTEIIEPSDVIILEGLLVLEDELIRNKLDIKIFVDTDADVRFIRRLQRDVLERGRTMDSVIKQYLTTVKPMHEGFVEPSKKYADVIIPEGGHNIVAIDLLNTKINSIITQTVL